MVVVAVGRAAAAPLAGPALSAHVLVRDPERAASGQRQQPHAAQLRRGRHRRGRGRRSGDICGWVRI